MYYLLSTLFLVVTLPFLRAAMPVNTSVLERVSVDGQLSSSYNLISSTCERVPRFDEISRPTTPFGEGELSPGSSHSLLDLPPTLVIFSPSDCSFLPLAVSHAIS